MDIVQGAFPKALWVFLYRDPVEVVTSHLNIRYVEQPAECLQSRLHPPRRVVDFLESSQLAVKDLSNEDYCAIYLASICDSAIEALKGPGSSILY